MPGMYSRLPGSDLQPAATRVAARTARTMNMRFMGPIIGWSLAEGNPRNRGGHIHEGIV